MNVPLGCLKRADKPLVECTSTALLADKQKKNDEKQSELPNPHRRKKLPSYYIPVRYRLFIVLTQIIGQKKARFVCVAYTSPPRVLAAGVSTTYDAQQRRV